MAYDVIFCFVCVYRIGPFVPIIICHSSSVQKKKKIKDIVDNNKIINCAYTFW